MYKTVESNASIIRINRGDSFQKPLFINCGTFLNPKRYTLQQGDKVYFGVMEPNHFWEQSILRQVYNSESDMTEDGDLLIKIRPEDTEYLFPGTYYYMVKLLREEEQEVRTIVPATLFVIL